MKLLNTKSLEKNISESTGVVVMRFISDEQYSYLMGQDALEQNYEEVVDYYAHSPDYPKVSQDSMTEYAKRLNNKLAELWPIAFSKPFPGLMICTPYGGQQYFEDFIYASSPELVWTRAVNNEFNRKHVAEFVARGKKIHVSSGSEGQYEDDDGKWIRPCWPSPTLRNQVKINRDELSGREASDSE
ncbi:MAG: hypothetical protein HYX41_00335, partial [Bdellovibrio sp.]|nr:hypothetical protein [Bdellovibrio sp.]